MPKVNWQTATPAQAQKMRDLIGENQKDAASLGLTGGKPEGKPDDDDGGDWFRLLSDQMRGRPKG